MWGRSVRGGGGRGFGLGGQGGCERRIEVFVKLKKNGGRVGGGQGGCERRIEDFVKIKKNGGSRVGGGSGWM